VPFDCRRTVEPTAGPVPLVTAKSHLRVSGTDEDPLIAAMLAGAVRQAERESGLQFLTATYALTLDDFPRACAEDGAGVIRLPVGPALSVSSIAYRDADNAPQTLSPADYAVGLKTGRIRPVSFWPSTYPYGLENVTVTYTAGFGAAAASVPADAVQAVLLILADRYENRGDEVSSFHAERPIPAGALRLLTNLRDGEQW
jgi:uncharacterized phiE125 gp8 family phage protein